MKDILIVYGEMGLGGSTTSLISLLSLFDYKKFRVDLQLAVSGGELFEKIPKDVHILESILPTDIHERKVRSLRSVATKIVATVVSKIKHSGIIKNQWMVYDNLRYCKANNKEYDVAISFIENFPLNYVAYKVKAKKKITWIHVDYIGAGFWSVLDKKTYKKFDNFVLVSDACKNSFDRCFPDLSDRSVVIENILSESYVKTRAGEECDFKLNQDYFNFITVCRITFKHKGLDRVIQAMKRLNQEGILDKIRWYVIGEGADYEKLKEMIAEYRLEKNVFLLGAMTNPLPYVKKMDAFLLPSRYEGKPMAITEAQMLDVPPIVTEYASAEKQIQNGIDGYIVPNTDEAIYDALKYVIDCPDNLKKWKKNLVSEQFDNIGEIKKIYGLIEG